MKALFLILATSLMHFSTCSNEEGSADLPKLEWTEFPDITALTTPDSLKYLHQILNEVSKNDQYFRMYFSPKSKLKLTKSQKAQINDSIIKYDKQNLAIVSEILDKHGWLDHKVVGVKANLTMFMVIQHADLKTQERFLPIISKAMADRQIMPSNYAMFIDRINIGHRKPQKYGSQINILPSGEYEILPLLNADSVDVWRSRIGVMQTMDQYLQNFNMRWDLNEYKKNHHSLMVKYKMK